MAGFFDFRGGDPRGGLISECVPAVVSVCLVGLAKLYSRQFFSTGSGNMNFI